MLSTSDELFIFPLFSDDEFTCGGDQTWVSEKKKSGNSQAVRLKWRRLVKKAINRCDPWEQFHLSTYQVEECLRYRYSSVRQKWFMDTVYVKMEAEPFGHGAMRECFRLKKSNSNEVGKDWSREVNYVAKRYMAQVARETYFEDVRLQMDAKLWAEEFNRHNPPKKIDIFQVSIIEMVNRPDKALYHLEHYIDGTYVKYNSNSGFVAPAYRQTPQAFSHFTFERSAHQLIVVDIQGVGDLYTDPQIHTLDGKGYGDGNLGTRGMALFFYSHCCNSICESMGLARFDLAPSERAARKRSMVAKFSLSETVMRPSDVEKCVSPPFKSLSAMEFVRARSASSMISYDESCGSLSNGEVFSNFNSSDSSNGSVPDSGVSLSTVRVRLDSDLDASTNGKTKDAYWEARRKQSRPACLIVPEVCVDPADDPKTEEVNIVLGHIHLDLARYHELGRFASPDGPYDRASAWFHLNAAARCGVHEAVITLARIYLGLPHELLHDFKGEDFDDDDDDAVDTGLDWMEQAAGRMEDRSAMLYMAEAYRTGHRLGSERVQSYGEAVKWYAKLLDLDCPDQEAGVCEDAPKYEILAKIAQLYSTGGPGLPRNASLAADFYSQAAAAATEAMKGKLATQYYILAEQASAEDDQ